MLVAVAGPRGVGKTTLINALCHSFSRSFARPTAYTTRSPRLDRPPDHFVYVNDNEFDNLLDQGTLLQEDAAYGNRYAISKISLREIEAGGRVPIHEVSHTNQSRMEHSGVELFRIAVVRDRIEDDSEWQMSPTEIADDYHIVVELDTEVQIAAAWVALKVFACRSWPSTLPDIRVVDKHNRWAYNSLSGEFYDDQRPTTSDFHAVSAPWWRAHLPHTLGPKRVLEVGPGNGWLTSMLNEAAVDFVCVECAGFMGGLLTSRVLAPSLRLLPFREEEFGAIVGSLVEGAHHPLVFSEFARVLEPGGLLLLTAPAWQWAREVRSAYAMHQTTFKLQSGEGVDAFSFVFDEAELLAMLQAAGFEEVQINSITGKQAGVCPTSAHARLAAAALGLAVDDLGLVDAIVARRRQP